ncbi:MAG: MBL fold metallo-hydrolase [Lachnospiraceae bacterium]|nr:MBL fold metallo-hydrolase [Lachnospiraceae bacterium]
MMKRERGIAGCGPVHRPRSKNITCKESVLLLFCAVLLLFLSGCGSGENTAGGSSGSEIHFSEESPHAKVTFFNVGKGDAILIETGEHAVLIDSGYDDTAKIILNYMKGQDIRYLDYLILTHFDKDHVGGADWILRGVETGAVLQPDYESDGGQYLEYVETVAAKGYSPVLVTETMEFSLNNVEFLIYPPQRESYEEEDNDFSLVTSMTCGEVGVLFAGDCEKERLKELLRQEEFSLSHEVLKVPHHGRKNKNSEEFIKAVSPKAAVITGSKEKTADEEVLRALEEAGTEIYFTEDKTVTCLCDGESFQMIQE